MDAAHANRGINNIFCDTMTAGIYLRAEHQDRSFQRMFHCYQDGRKPRRSLNGRIPKTRATF